MGPPLPGAGRRREAALLQTQLEQVLVVIGISVLGWLKKKPVDSELSFTERSFCFLLLASAAGNCYIPSVNSCGVVGGQMQLSSWTGFSGSRLLGHCLGMGVVRAKQGGCGANHKCT